MTNKLQNKPEPAEFLLYQTEDDQTRLEVRLQEEIFWLTRRRKKVLSGKFEKTEVSPFLKPFKFGCAISHEFSLRSTKNWHGV